MNHPIEGSPAAPASRVGGARRPCLKFGANLPRASWPGVVRLPAAEPGMLEHGPRRNLARGQTRRNVARAPATPVAPWGASRYVGLHSCP
jgi:hypothetical protein